MQKANSSRGPYVSTQLKEHRREVAKSLRNTMTNKPAVVFIHLDLGIGGAESLVLNFAKATLQPSKLNNFKSADGLTPLQSGSISIYTTHCSPTHCYDDVKPPNGPLFPFVKVCGSWIPRKLFFGGTALCSAFRMLYLTFRAIKENPLADVFVIDVLPTGVPYLVKYCNVKAGVLFYCHFPDQLLTRDTVNGEQEYCIVGNGSSNRGLMIRLLKHLRRWYRWILDKTEELTMSYSDLVVVNSLFTRAELEKTFPSLFLPRGEGSENSYGERIKVLYPAIESSLSREGERTKEHAVNSERALSKANVMGIVSLNRFERKKNVALLLHSYDLLLKKVSMGDITIKLPPLIIAGGYDPLNVENVEHLSELRTLADTILARHNLPRSKIHSPSSCRDSVTTATATQQDAVSIEFYLSVSNTKRKELLASASVLCYTPHREHFGIVPLEAMDAAVPVVAIRSGGPMETIVDGVTGILVDYEPIIPGQEGHNATVCGFADAIAKLISNPNKSAEMGRKGKERVHEIFGMETFRTQWWELLNEAQSRGKKRHDRFCSAYPSLEFSILRTLREMLIAFLFVLALTWSMRTFGLLENGRGLIGTLEVHYHRLIGDEQ
jgi:glycosyltransferase involved in cell wall biosynthesis